MDRARRRLVRRDDDARRRRCARRSPTRCRSRRSRSSPSARRATGRSRRSFARTTAIRSRRCSCATATGAARSASPSQSGCPLTCTFCATGAMRFGRNLTASEILDQALHFRRCEPVNHAVYMGMGEPFLNYEAVLESARAPSRPRDHASPDDDLDGRLDARAAAVRGRGRAADPPRAVDPRGRSRAALRAHAGERPLSARGRARRVPPLLRAPPPEGVRRVRHARGRERLAGRRTRARRASSSRGRSRSTHPVQPDRQVRRLVARSDRAFKPVLDRARIPRPSG